MRRDFLSPLVAARAQQAQARRLHHWGTVQSLDGNLATILVGYDSNNVAMTLEDVPVLEGITVAVGDYVQINYDADHPAGAWVGGGGTNTTGDSPPTISSAHDLLGATHSDVLVAPVQRGDLMVGNVTPKWSRLAKGGANTVLQSDGTDPAWTSSPTLGSITVSGAVVLGSLANVSAPAGNRAFLGYNVWYDGAWKRMQAGYVPWSWEMIYLGARMFKYTDADPPVPTQMLRIDTDSAGSTRMHLRKPSLGIEAGHFYTTPNSAASLGFWWSGFVEHASRYGEIGIWGSDDPAPAAYFWKDSGSLRGGIHLSGENYITQVDSDEFMQMSVVGATDPDGTTDYLLISPREGPIVFFPDSKNAVNRFLLPYQEEGGTIPAIDIGQAARQFRDIYLSHGVRLGESAIISVGTSSGAMIATTPTAKLGFHGATPVARQAHIADPTGGEVVDIETRAAVNSLLATLETYGFLAAS